MSLDQSKLPPMPRPGSILLCPPDHFDVVDEKNPFMRGQAGHVDHARAAAQWQKLRGCFESLGYPVCQVAPTLGCEDMVFAANQTLTGLLPSGRRAAILSNMKHASRQREVPAFAQWLREVGYEVLSLGDPNLCFEGAGDALWHPGRRLLWGGIGRRTETAAYEHVAELFDVPVVLLPIRDMRFYHLDTCFMPLDERTALVIDEAFDASVRIRIDRFFERVLDVPMDEAVGHLAANVTALPDRKRPDKTHVLLTAGARRTAELLKGLGYAVHELEMSEFQKSGGSVFCLKQYLW